MESIKFFGWGRGYQGHVEQKVGEQGLARGIRDSLPHVRKRISLGLECDKEESGIGAGSCVLAC